MLPPRIERAAPLEQDAGCVGTDRGHGGQQSYFCNATGPPGVDTHSFIQLPVSREGDTQRDKCSPKRTNTQLHIWSVTGSAVGFSTEKNQPVYSLTAFSVTVVNELEDISNVELYNQLIGQFEPAQYIF